MSSIKFSDIKDKLQVALQEKLKNTPISHENGFALVEGFMTLPLQEEISNNVVIGGPNIPIIAIVGNTSGRIYTFALKAILPEVKI
jgi:hypothetical protein